MSDTTELLGRLPLFEELNPRELSELGAVAVPSVVGVAWHGGNVYLFSGAQPGVSVVNVASLAVAAVTLSGDPAPASWVGAGSTSAYP